MNLIEELFGRMVFLRIGWALLHFLWQGAVVAAALAVALRLMRRRSPNARYLAACAAAVLLAALVSLTAWQMPLPQWSLPAKAAPAAPLPAAVSAPLPAAALAPAIPAAEVAQAAPPAAPWTDRAVEALGHILPYIVTAWIAGVALMSLWRTAGWVRVHRLKLSGSRGVGEDLSARLAALARRLGVARPVRLMRSALATTPTVIGWLRPVLLLPASAVTGLTSEQLQAVLAHELAHVRRHDYLVNLLQTVVETLLFYHPAVWWVSAQIRAERENCCDDVAAEACGGRYAYAEALVAIASLAPARPRLALAATGGSLLARVRRLLGVQDDRSGRSTRWLGGAAAMATVLCLTLAVTLTRTPAESAGGPADVVVTRLHAAEKLTISVRDGRLRVEVDTGKATPPAVLELSADGVVMTDGTNRLEGPRLRARTDDFQIDAGDGKLTFRVGPQVVSAVAVDGKIRLRMADPATGADTTRIARRLTVDPKAARMYVVGPGSASMGEEHTGKVVVSTALASPEGADWSDAGATMLPQSRPPVAADRAPSNLPEALGPGDVVEVTVLSLLAEGSETVLKRQLSKTGQIDLTLLKHPVEAGGLTASQLKAAIAKAYRDEGVFKDPQVSVSVVLRAGRTFAILGAVPRTGVYAIPDKGLVLAEALAMAGGAIQPGIRYVYVIRHGQDKPIAIDLSKLTGGDPRMNIAIHEGDSVHVPSLPVGEFYVMGEVIRPGVYSLSGRMVTAKMGVVAAGPPPSESLPAMSVLIRRVDGKETRIPLDLPAIFAGKAPDMVLKPDNVLVVGADRGAETPTSIPVRGRIPTPATPRPAMASPGEVYIMGAVQRPGVYSITGRRITLLQLLAAAAFEPQNQKGMTAVLIRRGPDGKETRTGYDIDALLGGKADNPALQADDTVLVKPGPKATAAVDQQQREMMEQLVALEAELRVARGKLGPNHRQVKELEGRLAALQDALRPIPAGSDAAKTRQTEKKLDAVLPRIEFPGDALAEVIQFLRDAAKVNIVVDWKGLEKLKVDESTYVSIRLQDVSVGKVLEKVLQSAAGDKLRFDVDEEGVITISAAAAPSPAAPAAPVAPSAGIYGPSYPGSGAAPAPFEPGLPAGGAYPASPPAPATILTVFRVAKIVEALLVRPDIAGDKTKAYTWLADLLRRHVEGGRHGGAGKLKISADLSREALLVGGTQPQMDAVKAVMNSLAKYGDRDILVSALVLKLLSDDEAALRDRLGKLRGRPVRPDQAEEFTLDAEALGQLRSLAAKVKDIETVCAPKISLRNLCSGMVKTGQRMPVPLQESAAGPMGMGMGGPGYGPSGFRGPGPVGGKPQVAYVDVGLSLSVDAWILPDGRRISLTAGVEYEQPDWLTWEKTPEIKTASARLSGIVDPGQSLLLRVPLAYTQRQRLATRPTKVDGKEQFEVLRDRPRASDKAIIEGYLYVFLTPEVLK